MRELVFNTGGRKFFNDDLRDIQDLAKSFESLYAGNEPFAVSGLTVTRVSGNTYNIGAGYVWVGGRLRLFDGASNIDLGTPKFINVRDAEESREYNDTNQKVAVISYGCTLSSTTLGGANSLRINAGGTMRRYITDVLGSRMVLLNPTSAMQTVNGDLTFKGKVAIEGTASMAAASVSSLKSSGNVEAQTLTLKAVTVAAIQNAGTLSGLDTELPAANVVKSYVDAINTKLEEKISSKSGTADGNLLGFIQMYSGTLLDRFNSTTGLGMNAYASYALCNGLNGTPDLRGRFIVGAGDKYALGNVGGAETVTLSISEMPIHGHGGTTATAGSHTHTASTGIAGGHSHTGSTSLDGSHTHTLPTGPFAVWINNQANAGSGSSGYEVSATPQNTTSSAGTHSHTFTTNIVGDHTHTVTVDAGGVHAHAVANDGGGQPHENRPPFHALYYIMKIA